MKKQLLYMAATFGLCVTQVKAQSIAHFFKEDHSGYSVDARTSTTEFIAAGTIYNTSDKNAIHVVHYKANGNIINSVYLDDPNADDRAVKVINLSNGKFAVVGYYQDLSTTAIMGQVRVVILDYATLSIQAEERYAVNSPTSLASLYPLDAIYDAIDKQIVICGTAVKGTAFKKSSSKQAFVLTLDGGLNVVNLGFYGDIGPYGIATKVIRTSDKHYYVTGSENLNKGGVNVMGIRNMILDPLTLTLVNSIPLALTTSINSSENSVDMIEKKGPYGLAYNVLVNFEDQKTWGIIRIDPASLKPYTYDFEHSIQAGVGYGFLDGNGASTQAVVTGMMDASNPNAVPFEAFLDFSSDPALCTQVDYPTVKGNNNGIVNFWNMGGFYAENNTYPLPSFLHEFAARQWKGSNTDFGIIAPIIDKTNTWLNTKFVYADVNAKNPMCPFGSNTYFLKKTYNAKPYNPGPNSVESAKPQGSALKWGIYNPYGTDDCTNGYYKLADGSLAPDMKSLVYPNPANGNIYLNLSSYGDNTVSVHLYDMAGKHIATVYEGTAKETVNYLLPSDIAKGLYMLSIDANGQDKRFEKISVQ